MIRRHQRQPCARQFHLHDFDLPLVVDVIEVQHRKHARIRPATPQVRAQVDALQALVEHRRREPSHPLVEVAEHDLRAANAAIVDDGLEAPGLMASFEKRRAQVDVVQMQRVVAKATSTR